MHNLHSFLWRSFRNTRKSRVLRLRLQHVFDRDALEGRIDRELHTFARHFLERGEASC